MEEPPPTLTTAQAARAVGLSKPAVRSYCAKYGAHLSAVAQVQAGTERWLRVPLQRNALESNATRDVLPDYAFTPDGRAVVVSYDGRLIEGHHGPSSDTQSHLGIYAHRPDVQSVVHTHSRYATAFAAVGKPIPCCLTAIADEFGGPVPCGAYAPIGGDAIGKEVVASIGRSPAILMRQHGVFTIGPTISKALQAAIMVEDVARTVAVALSVGEISILSDEEIEANYDRYHNRYGTMAASHGVS